MAVELTFEKRTKPLGEADEEWDVVYNCVSIGEIRKYNITNEINERGCHLWLKGVQVNRVPVSIGEAQRIARKTMKFFEKQRRASTKKSWRGRKVKARR